MKPSARTVARSVSVKGHGLFTEAACQVSIHPAQADQGVIIERGGIQTPASIAQLSNRAAHPAFESMPARSTNLRLTDGTVVFTVEHILSAIAGLGITAAIIEVHGPELPIGNGSADAFVEALTDAGTSELGRASGSLISQPWEAFIVGDTRGPHIQVSPASETGFLFHLDYGQESPIPRQRAEWDGTAETYAREIAPARTYCLESEAIAMQSAGLFKSFTPRDFLVIGADGPIDNTYRLDDEPARHKMLDLIGDLALGGLPLPSMRVEAFGSGHALNHEVATRLAALRGGTV